ncbi:MAG: AAA family ATPase, partial [Acidobacteria bacterium]|nr:AAA family ATPase [Acidobacteriota bacterium]
MEAVTDDLYTEIEIRPANEWMREGKAQPMPKPLFGDLWLEGELAVLFGDTGSGKSVLAAAIAESLARGPSIGPFENTARPQRVLYVDLDLSSKQFEMRYTDDHEPRLGEFSRRPYRFSERFRRIELKPEMLPQSKDGEFEIDLRRMLRALIERAGANVLIIDSLSHLKRTADETRGWVSVLKELKRLKQETGISILVLAGTLKRSFWRTLVAGDVQGSRAVANFADNIFAIGRCRREGDQRYIKHVRPRSSELVFGTDNFPVFRIAKTGGNFLTFEFLEVASEADLIQVGSKPEPDKSLIETVKHLSSLGMSIRQVAAELDISKSAVHRYLHTPLSADDDDDEEYEDEEEAEEYDPTTAWDYFPGREEFDAVKSDPRFEGIFDREDAEAHALRR